jgi:lipopolysaccharide assembly outer membrane protein LptD (OstA)
MKNRIILLLWLVVGLLPGRVQAVTNEVGMIVEAVDQGEFTYDLPSGTATATNGVRVRYGTAVMTANQVTFRQDKAQVTAEGNVILMRDGQVWIGENVTYDFKNRKLEADHFRTGVGAFYAIGETVSTDLSNHVYVTHNATVTADDFSTPAQSIRAREVTIVPGQYIEARKATLYLGSVPVMYLPYYKRTLGQHPNYYEFTPGYRSKYGPYLLNTYHWTLNQQVDGALHFDYRVRRGTAGGPDLNLHLGRWGETKMKYYFAHDEDPGKDIVNNPIRADRQRFSLIHEATISSNLMAKIVARYQSDQQVIRDFFEHEYRRNVQPNSYVELNRLWNNFSLDFLAQPRINDFNETIERLPDIRLTGYRQQLGESPFFYESESSFGWFRRKYANNTLPDYAAWRGDTYHQVVLPQTFFGWLNFTPRVGGRFTAYTDASGNGATTTDQSRGVFNTGAELSTKASRVWPGLQNKTLAIDGLRHITQPGINYVFVPAPGQRPNLLPQFDYELNSYRLLPIDFTDYNAIDSIDSQNAMRVSLWNKLQTKRAGEVENLVNWGVYTDWRINPRVNQGSFADLYSDLDFRPRSWVSLSQESRYGLTDDYWKELNHRVTFLPKANWSLTLGNRYLRNDPTLGPNTAQNVYYSSIYYRLNENWAFRVAHHVEARDRKLEEQYYTVYRDLRSWTGAFTVRARANRYGPDDLTVAVTFSIKAFPRFGLGEDRDRPSMLLGG